ncbi:HupE/UreJ family protein [Allohahella marinimesophila]|uniref:HupE/UreJ family protein n=1 Tax=Allohahella marinimesophila TaxID=1054972 RepID=A0ABP7PXW6_9GAMM
MTAYQARTLFFACLIILFPVTASAHTLGSVDGFASGFLHPLLGWDHIAAMVAVGLWGAFMGRTAMLLLPVVFPLAMGLGAALGMSGLVFSGIEIGIAVSAIAIGSLIAFGVRMPLVPAACMVGVFAVFHGFAHGSEVPASSGPLIYTGGFMMATGLLHLAGISMGLLLTGTAGRAIVRTIGGMVTIAGLAFLGAAV